MRPAERRLHLTNTIPQGRAPASTQAGRTSVSTGSRSSSNLHASHPHLVCHPRSAKLTPGAGEGAVCTRPPARYPSLVPVRKPRFSCRHYFRRSHTTPTPGVTRENTPNSYITVHTFVHVCSRHAQLTVVRTRRDPTRLGVHPPGFVGVSSCKRTWRHGPRRIYAPVFRPACRQG